MNATNLKTLNGNSQLDFPSPFIILIATIFKLINSRLPENKAKNTGSKFFLPALLCLCCKPASHLRMNYLIFIFLRVIKLKVLIFIWRRREDVEDENEDEKKFSIEMKIVEVLIRGFAIHRDFADDK
jgi:hypothetical protein